MSKKHSSACMSVKPLQLIPLLPFAFLLLFFANAIADTTFYSVNVLKALFFSTPHVNLPDAFDILSPEAVLPAFDPVSCACGSNGLVDGHRTCNPPHPPYLLLNQSSVPNSSPVCYQSRLLFVFSIYGLIVADLIAIHADNEPTPNFPLGFFDVRVHFPHSPSHDHVAAVGVNNVFQRSSIYPHNFVSIRHEMSCDQLCATADDHSSANNVTAQPIVLSLIFSPCPSQSIADSSFPCLDVNAEAEDVISAQIVLGISSEMMSLANLTLEHIVGRWKTSSSSTQSVQSTADESRTVTDGSDGSNGNSDVFEPTPSRSSFTTHHCTQLHHAHSSGPGPPLPLPPTHTTQTLARTHTHQPTSFTRVSGHAFWPSRMGN
jgi:hypothetical protein